MALTDETISALTEAISKIIESSLTESVLKRLDSFGYTLSEADVYAIAFSVQKVEDSIKNDCNVSEIPEGLMNIAVDMVCGEMLGTLYRTGKLSLDGLDLDGAIASVSAGDTSVSFDNAMSDDGKFTTLVQLLQGVGRGEFACYRKIRW